MLSRWLKSSGSWNAISCEKMARYSVNGGKKVAMSAKVKCRPDNMQSTSKIKTIILYTIFCITNGIIILNKLGLDSRHEQIHEF